MYSRRRSAMALLGVVTLLTHAGASQLLDDVAPRPRLPCGHRGMTQRECEAAKGCVWDASALTGPPRCVERAQETDTTKLDVPCGEVDCETASTDGAANLFGVSESATGFSLDTHTETVSFSDGYWAKTVLHPEHRETSDGAADALETERRPYLPPSDETADATAPPLASTASTAATTPPPSEAVPSQSSIEGDELGGSERTQYGSVSQVASFLGEDKSTSIEKPDRVQEPEKSRLQGSSHLTATTVGDPVFNGSSTAGDVGVVGGGESIAALKHREDIADASQQAPERDSDAAVPLEELEEPPVDSADSEMTTVVLGNGTSIESVKVVGEAWGSLPAVDEAPPAPSVQMPVFEWSGEEGFAVSETVETAVRVEEGWGTHVEQPQQRSEEGIGTVQEAAAESSVAPEDSLEEAELVEPPASEPAVEPIQIVVSGISLKPATTHERDQEPILTSTQDFTRLLPSSDTPESTELATTEVAADAKEHKKRHRRHRKELKEPEMTSHLVRAFEDTPPETTPYKVLELSSEQRQSTSYAEIRRAMEADPSRQLPTVQIVSYAGTSAAALLESRDSSEQTAPSHLKRAVALKRKKAQLEQNPPETQTERRAAGLDFIATAAQRQQRGSWQPSTPSYTTHPSKTHLEEHSTHTRCYVYRRTPCGKRRRRRFCGRRRSVGKKHISEEACLARGCCWLSVTHSFTDRGCFLPQSGYPS